MAHNTGKILEDPSKEMDDELRVSNLINEYSLDVDENFAKITSLIDSKDKNRQTTVKFSNYNPLDESKGKKRPYSQINNK